MESPFTRPRLGVHSRDLLGRDDVLREIASCLQRGHNVLLYGPPYVGKTALIESLGPHDATVLDPFEDVSPHLAAEVRRAMDRGGQYLAATRSLDRGQLGAVRRIAWRFTVVRVPPLARRVTKRLILCHCTALGVPAELLTHDWLRAIADLSHGRPGLALAMSRAAARTFGGKGVLPLPPAAYVKARIRQEWPEHIEKHDDPEPMI